MPATGPRARKLGSGLMMYDADVDRQNKVAGTNRIASGLVSESEMGRVRCGELGPKAVVGGGCRAERVQVGRCGLLYVAGSTHTQTCASTMYTHTEGSGVRVRQSNLQRRGRRSEGGLAMGKTEGLFHISGRVRVCSLIAPSLRTALKTPGLALGAVGSV